MRCSMLSSSGASNFKKHCHGLGYETVQTGFELHVGRINT